MITSEQRYGWRIALELKLRKSSGDAFQDFFSNVMAAAYGSDFIRVRPYGALGDKGCDGYLQSTGAVFACYGAINGSSWRVDYLIKKISDDFVKAKGAFVGVMNQWLMVHNLVDGLPTEAVLELDTLKRANRGCAFGFMGMEAFEATIFGLPVSKIEDLLGPVATAHDAQNLQTKELRDLVLAVVHATDAQIVDISAIKPVPPDKLDFNGLPSHWRLMISSGWQSAHFVEQYLRRHHDPMTGERVAQYFRGRYGYLKSQGLDPSAIMSTLYTDITGIGVIAPQRQVAAQALLSHLFESCDIFETPPEAVR